MQLSLLPPLPVKPLNADQQAVLDALTFGPATAYELQTRLANAGIHRKENCVSKRLSELGQLGKAERTGETRCGSSHRKQNEWRLV